VKIPRHYVVHLQHKVRELELQLEHLESDNYEPDPEDMVRGGAAVRIQEHDESKFLGPSSGIAITRLVMQLAKQFTDSQSITDIVDQTKAQEIKQIYENEEEKPTSKVYPLISDVAADELPQRDLTTRLVKLFNAKGELKMFIALSEGAIDLGQLSISFPYAALIAIITHLRLKSLRKLNGTEFKLTISKS
jgi:hypothetical protein